jgi:transcriptional regulator with XRE-family HTH domain
MSSDTMSERHKRAAQAFTDRRGGLGLTQEDIAREAGIAVRTVQNFESGRWPNPKTRGLLERAVRWPAGEIARLASPPRPRIDPQLLDRVRELDPDDREWMAEWLRSLGKDPGRPGRAASG